MKGFLRWDGGAWTGRTGSGAVDRSSLVPGSYKPNTPEVVGLIPGQPITNQVFPSPNPSSTIVLSASSYENTIFWGRTQYGNASGTDLSNCIMAGPDPADAGLLAAGLVVGNFQSFDSSTILRPKVTFTDCLFSNAPWRDNSWGLGRPLASGAVRTPSPLSAGVHGGMVDLIRCEFTDIQDCVNYAAGNAGSSCLIEACYFHKTWYQNGWTGPGSPPSQDTHSDFFQFGRGKNIVVRHNLFGGYRDQAAYDITPPGGYNAGEDTFGAGFMCKQEAGYTAYDQIHNVEIRHNWIYGCEYGFNMVYVAARPYLWDDCTIADNIFSTTKPPQFTRITKSNVLTPTVTGNILEETGATVPAVNSGYSE